MRQRQESAGIGLCKVLHEFHRALVLEVIPDSDRMDLAVSGIVQDDVLDQCTGRQTFIVSRVGQTVTEQDDRLRRPGKSQVERTAQG